MEHLKRRANKQWEAGAFVEQLITLWRYLRNGVMPILACFPHPVQKLILEEYCEVERDGGITLCELGDDIICRCLFYCQWQLPCCHIILQEKVFGGVLTDSYWDNWYRKWDESGFELYEGIMADYMNGPVDKEIGAPRRILMDVIAVFEELKTRLYMFHENMKYWPYE